MVCQSIEHAKDVLKILKKNGHDAYIVGGAVRDHFLNRPISDVDLATSALPDEVMSIFEKTIPIAPEHGTVLVRHNQCSYEVTTFRSEGSYTDFRRPDHVHFESSIIKDLERRDFTINAMAIDEASNLTDPFNGQKDIDDRQLRTVGDARLRFEEDALRILRAARFTAQLGFQPSEEMAAAMKQKRHLLQHIAMERISVEFQKLLAGQAASQGVTLLLETEVFQFLPYLLDHETALHTLAQRSLHVLESAEEYWAVLLVSLGLTEADGFYKSWCFSKKVRKRTERLLSAVQSVNSSDWKTEDLFQLGLIDALAVDRLQYVLGFTDHTHVDLLNSMWEGMAIHTKKDIKANGHDLCHWLNKKPGPWLAVALDDLARAIIQGNVSNNRLSIEKWVKQSCLERKNKS